VLLCIAGLAMTVAGQSLEERLDEDLFLQGLIELELPEVLEHYIRTHPPADPVQEASYRIAADRLRLRRLSGDPAARLAAIERILATRGALIEEQKAHPRRAIWLTDQAADLFFELLPTEATDLTALFGLPSESQRLRAERVASRMNETTALAELEIQRAIRQIESAPGYREDESLQMQRRRLARDERDRRIPFLRGVGAFLHAELDIHRREEKRQFYEIAARLLKPLEGELLEGSLLSRVRLYRGLALARLGEYEEAEALFRQVATDEQSSPRDVFAARMGGVLNRLEERGPQAALTALDSIEGRYAGAEELFYRVLLADQRFLLLRAVAAGESGPERRRALGEAFASYLDLLGESDDVPRDTMRAIVYARLAQAADDQTPLEDLPAIVTVARADQLVHREGRAADAVLLLQSVLERPDLAGDEQAAALFGLGRALYEAGQPLDGLRCFLRMAREHPADPEAPRAIELAATIGADLHRKYPGDEEVRGDLGEALTVLLAQYPDLPEVNHWRYVAGRLAMSEGDYDGAAALLEQVPTDAGQWPDAQFMLVNAQRAAARAATDAAERRRRHEEVLSTGRRVGRALQSALGRVSSSRGADLLYYLSFLRVFCAEALLELEEPRAALEALAGIEGEAGLDNAALAAALRVRIDAHQALGHLADARGEIERLLEAAPAEAGGVIDAMLASMLADVEALREVGVEEEAQRKVQRELVPLARLLERWIDTSEPAGRDRRPLLRRAADVYRLGGSFGDGLRLYERLLRGQPDAVELLFGRAECLFGLDDEREAQAMGLYKRIAAEGPDIGRHYYWQAQVRMLQILDRVRQNTERIAPRIHRLRLQDPELGGDRYRRQFQRLERKYAGES